MKPIIRQIINYHYDYDKFLKIMDNAVFDYVFDNINYSLDNYIFYPIAINYPKI